MESLTTIANRHSFSNTFTTEYDEDVTAKTIITPTTGKAITVLSAHLSTEGGTSGGEKVRLYFATSADTIGTIYVTNAVQNTALDNILITGAINEPVKITSNLGVGKNYFISVSYREE